MMMMMMMRAMSMWTQENSRDINEAARRDVRCEAIPTTVTDR